MNHEYMCFRVIDYGNYKDVVMKPRNRRAKTPGIHMREDLDIHISEDSYKFVNFIPGKIYIINITEEKL